MVMDFSQRLTPKHTRADNGPEMISKAVKSWCQKGGKGTLQVNPGSPSQNGMVESINGRPREELLSLAILHNLSDVKCLLHR